MGRFMSLVEPACIIFPAYCSQFSKYDLGFQLLQTSTCKVLGCVVTRDGSLGIEVKNHLLGGKQTCYLNLHYYLTNNKKAEYLLLNGN